jgi:hypothetical protein
MNNDSILEKMSDTFADKELFEVILWERNKVLANAIQTSEYNKIFVTYWLLHFKWVYELLKQNDNNWQITETKYLYPIRN